jgi:hypothetical protein
MRQTNLYEFLNDFEEALRQEAHKETGSEDTTETDFEPEAPSMTPIEEMITVFIKSCTTQHRIPTLEEAQAIHILDAINSKYQD